MDQTAAKAFIDALWDAEVIPELTRLHPHPQQVAGVRP